MHLAHHFQNLCQFSVLYNTVPYVLLRICPQIVACTSSLKPASDSILVSVILFSTVSSLFALVQFNLNNILFLLAFLPIHLFFSYTILTLSLTLFSLPVVLFMKLFHVLKSSATGCTVFSRFFFFPSIGRFPHFHPAVKVPIVFFSSCL